MDPENTIDHLITSGILETDGEELYVANHIRDLVEERDPEVEKTEFEFLKDLDEIGSTGNGESVDPQFESLVGVIQREVDDMPEDQLFKSALLLFSYIVKPEKVHGTPDGFLIARGSWLEVIGTVFPKMMVYVWREDCDPCDTMKSALSEMDIPDEVLPISIFGPESAQLLREKFDVQGGPTTLFVRENSVMTRLHGVHPPNALEKQVTKLIKHPV